MIVSHFPFYEGEAPAAWLLEGATRAPIIDDVVDVEFEDVKK
ncbi:MAG: hypothetical protein A4E57_01109 [Syntrophorhabdaceae bacterium PtaU1.Bin034]|jgi:hypothetical protein|nr:MAG: hypothetical protein A4E57_01109 [Syntrophorhabdaceae bacterium PtaU1.Bin034]